MHMVPLTAASSTNLTQLVAGIHGLPYLNTGLPHMKVPGKHTTPMIDNHRIAANI